MVSNANIVDIAYDDALIVVDVQNDFCPNGSLPVDGGDQVVPIINDIMSIFSHVVATQDYHPENHKFFKHNGGPWPRHCIMYTNGAEFHPDLNVTKIDHVFQKGIEVEKDGYSGFTNPLLLKYLREKRVKRVFVCGLATDYCVKSTAIDAVASGFPTFVIVDAIRAVNITPGDGERALAEMNHRGAMLTSSRVLRKINY